MLLDNAVWREGWETRPFGYSVLTQGGSCGEKGGRGGERNACSVGGG